jgi:hypothetical protein
VQFAGWCWRSPGQRRDRASSDCDVGGGGGGCQRRLSTMVVAARRRTTRHALLPVRCAQRVCARSRGGWRRTPIPVLWETKQARRQSAMCHISAAVCSDARAAGTVLISTTNLVTLPAPPCSSSCYVCRRLQSPSLCSACSAFAAAVALLVLCLSIVCVTVCLLLSVRVCLREPLQSVHVCMSAIVYQGVSFTLLLSAPPRRLLSPLLPVPELPTTQKRSGTLRRAAEQPQQQLPGSCPPVPASAQHPMQPSSSSLPQAH